MKNLIAIKRFLPTAILLASATFLASAISADEKKPAPTSTLSKEDERDIRTIIMSIEGLASSRNRSARSYRL